MIKSIGFFELLKETYLQWIKDSAPRLGAALAYYTIFSLGPLLLLILAIFSFVFGEIDFREHFKGEISSLVGTQAGEAIKDILMNASNSQAAPAVSIIGIVLLVLGSTGVFCQLQDAMDSVWEVRRIKNSSFLWIIIERWVSLLMVLGIGFMLLVSLVISTSLTFLASYGREQFLFSERILEIVHSGVALILITVLFAAIYKVIPNVNMPWRCVWGGAFLASFAFVLGKFLIGLYLAHSAISSSFGAAGSLIVILIWTYYSTQILLFGAEYTQAYAKLKGIVVTPKKGYEFYLINQDTAKGIVDQFPKSS